MKPIRTDHSSLVVAGLAAIGLAGEPGMAADWPPRFDPEKDLIALHYDHAPDRDDGQSAAADRTLLQSLYGKDWIADHVVAVSGAYGTNAESFKPESRAVMDACWNDCGGWLDAHADRDEAVKKMTARWSAALKAGGDIWVKEGGQSDLTAAVVANINRDFRKLRTRKRVHVVQHGSWNERHTTASALAFVKENTNYIRIRNANHYLKLEGGDRSFEEAARKHPAFGKAWKAAFDYYDPEKRLDFSDTGELMHLLGLGEIGFDEFQKRYLDR